jgi:hypothetical protein
LSPHAELCALSDNVLLGRLRGLPRGSAEREAICEILVSRYAGLVRACVRPYLRSPEPSEDLPQTSFRSARDLRKQGVRSFGAQGSVLPVPCHQRSRPVVATPSLRLGSLTAAKYSNAGRNGSL